MGQTPVGLSQHCRSSLFLFPCTLPRHGNKTRRRCSPNTQKMMRNIHAQGLFHGEGRCKICRTIALHTAGTLIETATENCRSWVRYHVMKGNGTCCALPHEDHHQPRCRGPTDPQHHLHPHAPVGPMRCDTDLARVCVWGGGGGRLVLRIRLGPHGGGGGRPRSPLDVTMVWEPAISHNGPLYILCHVTMHYQPPLSPTPRMPALHSPSPPVSAPKCPMT